MRIIIRISLNYQLRELQPSKMGYVVCITDWYLDDKCMGRTYGVKSLTLNKLIASIARPTKFYPEDVGIYEITTTSSIYKVLKNWNRLENKPSKQYYYDYMKNKISVKEFIENLKIDILLGEE